MGLKLDAGSRFQLTNTVLVTTPNGEVVETFSVWKRPSFLTTRPREDLIGRYQVLTGRVARPDLIATELYGSPYLDWIIVAFNGAMDVLNWPEAGSVIEYPLPSLVFAEVD